MQIIFIKYYSQSQLILLQLPTTSSKRKFKILCFPSAPHKNATPLPNLPTPHHAPNDTGRCTHSALTHLYTHAHAREVIEMFKSSYMSTQWDRRRRRSVTLRAHARADRPNPRFDRRWNTREGNPFKCIRASASKRGFSFDARARVICIASAQLGRV